MPSQAMMNSKKSKHRGHNPGNLRGSVRESKYQKIVDVYTRAITMKRSSNPSCLTTRDLTYSRTKTNTVVRTTEIMVVIANAEPLLRSPPAGGLPSEAIIGFFRKAKECTTRQLNQAGRFPRLRIWKWKEQEAGHVEDKEALLYSSS